MMTWFMFFCTLALVSFALAFGASVVGAFRDSNAIFPVFAVCFLSGVGTSIAAIVTGAWSLAAWVTR